MRCHENNPLKLLLKNGRVKDISFLRIVSFCLLFRKTFFEEHVTQSIHFALQCVRQRNFSFSSRKQSFRFALQLSQIVLQKLIYCFTDVGFQQVVLPVCLPSFFDRCTLRKVMMSLSLVFMVNRIDAQARRKRH